MPLTREADQMLDGIAQYTRTIAETILETSDYHLALQQATNMRDIATDLVKHLAGLHLNKGSIRPPST